MRAWAEIERPTTNGSEDNRTWARVPWYRAAEPRRCGGEGGDVVPASGGYHGTRLACKMYDGGMPSSALAIASIVCAYAAPPERPADIDVVMKDISPQHLRATIDKLVTFGTRHTLSSRDDAQRGIGAAARWLRDEMAMYAKASGRDDIVVELMDHVQPAGGGGRRRGAAGGDGAATQPAATQPAATQPERPGTPITNVVMTIPGSMPESKDRRIVVLGHYDSRNGRGNDAQNDAPGANDDGSGTALTVELARIIAASKQRPECTVVFLLTAAEEQGLWGAQWYARTAVDNNWRIDAALSNDIVGDSYDRHGKPDRARIRLFSEGLPSSALADARAMPRIRQLGMESDSPSRQLARYVADIATRHDTAVKPWLIFRPDRFLRGGDHSAFNEHGFAAVRFTEVEENYDRQHQNITEKDGKPYGDVAEFVDEQYLAGVAALNGAALWTLANAPAAPLNARLVTSGLGLDTTIRWDANTEPDIAGYEIVWRDTTSPTWDNAVDAGNVTAHTIDLSKDNYFFGVRAYDRDGHRSLVTYCGAGRD